MTHIYRETDPVSGRWTGNSGGIDLSAFQQDQNFYQILQAIATLNASIGSTIGIAFITISGNELTFHMTDHTLQGPLAIPISVFLDRGVWTAATSYAVNDTFTINGTLYLVIFAHVSAGSFDAGANDGLGHNFYSAMLSLPGAALPTGGAAGMMLKKVDGHDFHVTWGYPIPVGGGTGQFLVKINGTDFNAAWGTFYTIPTGGSTGQKLLKHSGTNGDTEWAADGIETMPDFALASPILSNDLMLWNGAAWQNSPQSALSISYTQMSDHATPSQNRQPTATALGTTGTVSLDPTLGDVHTITPTGNVTLNAASAPVGARITVIVTTSGTSSFNITPSANFKSTGALATGVSSGKTFSMSFEGDGVNLVETGRTVAM